MVCMADATHLATVNPNSPVLGNLKPMQPQLNFALQGPKHCTPIALETDPPAYAIFKGDNMPEIQVHVSEEVLFSLKETVETVGSAMKLLTAAKLVELGKLSTGRAADLAGMSRVEFLDRLRELRIDPTQLSAGEVVGDATNI